MESEGAKRLGLMFGKKREELGLSQSAVAKAVGISRPYLTQIETGKRFPSDDTAQAIVNTLGITTEELLLEVADLAPGPEIEALMPFARVFDKLKRYLTPEQLEDVQQELASANQAQMAMLAVAGESLPPGPYRWLDLNAEDRRFVQRMVNRLADGPKTKESRNDDHAED